VGLNDSGQVEKGEEPVPALRFSMSDAVPLSVISTLRTFLHDNEIEVTTLGGYRGIAPLSEAHLPPPKAEKGTLYVSDKALPRLLDLIESKKADEKFVDVLRKGNEVTGWILAWTNRVLKPRHKLTDAHIFVVPSDPPRVLIDNDIPEPLAATALIAC